MLSAVGKAFYTCGELVQGVVNNQDLMVTFPINICSSVVVTATRSESIVVLPPRKTKVAAIARAFLHERRPTAHNGMGLEIVVASSLPEGKGYASSSADMVAAYRALCALYQLDYSDISILKTCCDIEPSDAACFPEPTLFAFKTGAVIKRYVGAPRLLALNIDEGGSIDSETMPRPLYTEIQKKNLRRAFELIDIGLGTGDVDALGAATSLSAAVSQERVPKQHYELARRLCREHGGCGISVAHSGTTIAILFEESAASGLLESKNVLHRTGISNASVLTPACCNTAELSS